MKKWNKISKSQKILRIAGIVVLVAIALTTVGHITIKSDLTDKSVGSTGSANQVDHSITAKMITENPKKYKGKVVELTGKVFQTDKKGSTNVWQIWTDAQNYQGNIVVYYSGSSEIGNDNYVKFIGKIGDVLKGENAFGGAIGAPTVNASSVIQISRDEALAPAIKTTTPNVAQTQEGMTITVQKIEFAANETRIFLQVSNSSSGTVNFYSFDTKIVQGESQIKDKSVFETNKQDEIPSEVVAGTKETGKLYFEKADPARPMTISYQGFSSTSYHDLNFSFDIQP